MKMNGPGSWMLISGIVAALAAGTALAATSVSRDVEAPVQQAIDIRQDSQGAQEKWDEERSRLVAVYERLKAENEQLTATNDRLAKEAGRLKAVNDSLEEEHLEARRIQRELMPFLHGVVDRLKQLQQSDMPFLTGERGTRIARLSAVLDDPEISGAEKYRKTMEALFVEAEYGNTVEVYQDKIMLDGSRVLGNIFRLGRVSLFFLSLDQKKAAVFDVAQGNWARLDNSYVPSVAGAVDMAAKHRPMEVTLLPVGRLARPEGGALE